jgi:hypothetical protein
VVKKMLRSRGWRGKDIEGEDKKSNQVWIYRQSVFRIRIPPDPKSFGLKYFITNLKVSIYAIKRSVQRDG